MKTPGGQCHVSGCIPVSIVCQEPDLVWHAGGGLQIIGTVQGGQELSAEPFAEAGNDVVHAWFCFASKAETVITPLKIFQAIAHILVEPFKKVAHRHQIPGNHPGNVRLPA